MTAGGAQPLMAFLAGGDAGQNQAFREIVETLPAAIYATDSEGRLTYFNEAARKLSGRTPELGTDKWCVTWKLFLPDGTPLPHDQCPMALALKGVSVPNGIECVAERPDGTRFWFAAYPAVLRDSEGSIAGGVNLLVDITDRKSAEIEAGEQFRTIIETTPECVKIIARDGTLLFMNAQGLGMVGAASAEAIAGTKVYELIAPEDREPFREFNERICGGEKGSMEFDIVSLQGVRRHMESHAAPMRHADGSTVQLAITHDISERKRAERAGLLLSAIVDSSDDAIISKDLNGIITSWNRSAERLFGYTAAEAVGQSVTMLIPSDRLDEEPDILSRLRGGVRVEHFETVRRRKDGTLLDISLTISPVRDERGIIVGASKIARDISGRKRDEAMLLASEARFRQLADSMPHIVWTADAEGHIDYFNDRWYEFTGYSRDSQILSTLESILHPDDVSQAREAWAEAVRSGGPYNIEYRFWDGLQHRWRWFMARAVAIRDGADRVIKWFGTYTDIDDRKRLEEDLLRANQDLEQFAFSASHDLHEPLRTVKVYSELLAQSYGESLNEDARRCVQYLQNGASRMETLLRDLLTYTQLMKLDVPTETADANEALHAALANLDSAISENSATIDSGPLPSLRVHATHLQQLFQNLIGNAIKYRSPERVPRITVRAERENGQWTFAVSDNGIGIAPEYKEMVFVIFKRLHGSEQYAGSGIGLAICQRIVERYHGRIWVESEPGVGSTFRWTLPG
jgi:PAS domain S-box-containing protein